MKRVVITVVAMICLAACAKKPSNPIRVGAKLVVTYVADTHRTWTGCPSDCMAEGHGTVKNIGGSDAYGVRVRVIAACETFEAFVTPDALAPGQFGSYRTGRFCGGQNPKVEPIFREGP